MENIKKIINALQTEEYSDAVQIFQQTPNLNYETKTPLFKFEYFEFSKKTNKNPVFVRVLLNYISLINIINDLNVQQFHKILFKFHAKFSYEIIEEDKYIKLILMAESTPEVYNMILQKGVDNFEKNIYDNIDSIDTSFWDEDNKSIGYTFQELGRIFLNDYVIGRDKGQKLPNILFYIKSIESIQNLIGTLFLFPNQYKLNLKEKINHSGINEFDHIVELNQELKINENNPYFRYIKEVKENNSKYGELILEEDELYIIEFKHSYKMDNKIAKIENLGKLYLTLYNRNVENKEQIKKKKYKILYFYNYFENLGYKNLSRYNITQDLWRFLYLNPSCQIVPVIHLSSEVTLLKKKVTNLEGKTNEQNKEIELLKEDIKLLNEDKIKKDKEIELLNENILKKDYEMEKIKNTISEINKWKEQFVKEKIKYEKTKIIQGEKFIIKKKLKAEIEEMYKESIKKIKIVKDFSLFKELFEKYNKEINEFIIEADQLEINKEDNKWRDELKEDIKDSDFKTCFSVFAPCIGKNKASKNYKKIQNFLYNKILKEDEMSDIYHNVYLCFYGDRTIDDKKSFEKFYSDAKNDLKLMTLLINIIKYTFCYDKKRGSKEYYLLAMLKNLLDNGDKKIHNNMIILKNRSLYDLVFMTIILINSENQSLLYCYKKIPFNNNF